MFEVDHPATQQGKRLLLDAGSIASSATFVPVDFESDALLSRLVENGFDPAEPAVISWLGVVMYLTRGAIDRTLAEIAKCASGTELVLDYLLTEDLRDERGQTYVDMVASHAAENGEPWLSFFTPDDMAELLERHGFRAIWQAGQRESVPGALWDRTDAVVPSTLSVIAHAVLG
ncbi:methyltransferase (TIGR00027 family) [Actinocrispum wychmicini]|uniref:S-adenosyl-L-methionine-dependent methyltransferase n=1 Tax=Actinocrispum wychmicini TaxID=1213861 RepID=A0A4R2JE14_9PSEU|nr:methyltransferase (TIGR00027 family) [Actinocrispum wychmicini]